GRPAGRACPRGGRAGPYPAGGPGGFAEPRHCHRHHAVRGAPPSPDAGRTGMSGRVPLMSRPLPVTLAILIAILLDQLVKFAVEARLPFQEAVEVMPMLALYRTHNYGVAFSMLSGMEGWFIVTLRLFVVGFVVWLWRQTPKARGLAHAGYAFIIAGAFGNLIDRALFGYVIDYEIGRAS